MIEVLGEVLSYAVAIALSPMPIIAAILMLMSPKPKALSLSFLSGWVLGIAVATVLFTLLAGVLPGSGASGSQPVLGVIKLVLAGLLIMLAVKQWRSRPATGESAQLPKWMSAIDTMRPGAAFGLAFLLAAVNPKNLLMAVAAGASIGHAALGGGQATVVVFLFVVIAALSVAVPVVAALLAPGRAGALLAPLRTWLTANNATIMAIVLLLLGVQLLGRGLASF